MCQGGFRPRSLQSAGPTPSQVSVSATSGAPVGPGATLQELSAPGLVLGDSWDTEGAPGQERAGRLPSEPPSGLLGISGTL